MAFSRRIKKARRAAAKQDVTYALEALRSLDAQLIGTTGALLGGTR